jgi:Holliday junction resolvase RusA-like endonuclease
MDLYSMFARGGPDERLYYVQINGEPWSKSRPRFTRRGGTYQPKDDRDAEERLRLRLRVRIDSPFPGNVMLVCRFYRSNFQRIDTDNLLKHVCDSANGILWKDDSQVTFVLGEVNYDPDWPRTIILAGDHDSTLRRGDDRHRPCERCGAMFLPPAGKAGEGRRWCSRECSYAARTTALQPIVCPQCGVTFKPTAKRQVLCSQACVSAKLTNRNRAARVGPPSECTECGKTLTHRRGGRCRDCWRAAPNFYGPPPPPPCVDCVTDDCCGDCPCCLEAGWEPRTAVTGDVL